MKTPSSRPRTSRPAAADRRAGGAASSITASTSAGRRVLYASVTPPQPPESSTAVLGELVAAPERDDRPRALEERDVLGLTSLSGFQPSACRRRRLAAGRARRALRAERRCSMRVTQDRDLRLGAEADREARWCQFRPRRTGGARPPRCGRRCSGRRSVTASACRAARDVDLGSVACGPRASAQTALRHTWEQIGVVREQEDGLAVAGTGREGGLEVRLVVSCRSPRPATQNPSTRTAWFSSTVMPDLGSAAGIRAPAWPQSWLPSTAKEPSRDASRPRRAAIFSGGSARAQRDAR